MAYDSGESDRADRLAVTVGPAAGPSERADAAWVRAQVAYERDSPSRASILAMEAVAPILRTDPDRADSMLAEAAWCARDAGDPDLLRRCAELLRSDPGPGLLRPALIGLTGLLLGDHTAAAPMRAMLHAVRDGRIVEPVQRLTGGFLGILIGEDLLARSVLEQQVSQIRDDGQLGWLPYLHEPLALAQLMTGRFRDAEVTLAEATSLAGELGQHPADRRADLHRRLALRRPRRRRGLRSPGRRGPARRSDPGGRAAASDGRRDERVGAGDPGPDQAGSVGRGRSAGTGLPGPGPERSHPPRDPGPGRGGRADRRPRPGPAPAAGAARLGGAHREARRCWRWPCAARRSPTRARRRRSCSSGRWRPPAISPYDLARTRLAYGEWLRRHRRPNAAQDQLAQALATFDQLAAQGWKGRVEAELTALGVALPDQSADSGRGPGSLTPQELQVVRLAGAGLTNREIAAQLFLSPRTIGYHLYKAYPKLGVARRAELARLEL